MLGVVSHTVWATPRAEDLFLTWTFLVSQASQAQRFGKLHVELYLCSEKKLNLLKQFEGFCCCLFCSHRVTLLALNSMEMDLPMPQGAEIKGVRASKPGHGLNFSFAVLQCCSWAGSGDRLNLSIPEAKAGGSL